MASNMPQKGNPHQLTVRQHIFPRSCIKRFYNQKNQVCLYDCIKKKTDSVTAGKQIFCAERVWDQKAESILMKEIEDRYELLANSIVNGTATTIEKEKQEIVTDMFLLWNLRAHYCENPIDNQVIKGAIDVVCHYTQDELEQHEKVGIVAIRPDKTVPGNSIVGTRIPLDLSRERDRMSDAKWGILRATDAEFLVPDNFSNGRILPLSPNICLFSQSKNETIDKEEVLQINELAIQSSKKYLFARDFSKCPTINPFPPTS